MKKIFLTILMVLTVASCAKMPLAVSKAAPKTNYEVLGPVETDSYAILGMWGTDGSYEALVEAAKDKYKDEGIDVIDVSVSAQSYFLWYTFDLKGTAIKYNE